MTTYLKLNNEMMIPDKYGAYQYEKDKEATRAYFLEYVNKNTMFFHDLREKLDYLVEHNYYDRELLEQYSYAEVKAVYKAAYAKKFRFPSFMAAIKFYKDYALKTNDGKNILERYEDRIAINALFFGQGNVKIALEQVEMLINQEYQPATPTFLNAGRARGGELVSCFLLEIGDSLNDINMGESTAKQLSKIGGGVSTNLSKIRAKGESIRGVEGVTKGVVGVMKMLDHALRYADQQGQRNGAGAAYLHALHADIFDFLDTKKINADEDMRVKTLSIGVVVPDLLIKKARKNKSVYLFYPHSVYKEYGEHFDEMDLNKMYKKLVENPRVRKQKVNARQLLEKFSIMRFESGYPYLMFYDNVNIAHALPDPVKFSNLCTEVLQSSTVSVYTDYGQPDQIGYDISCNLGSLNIMNVMKNKSLGRVVAAATDALTVVAENTNIRNAPAVARANKDRCSIGLGAMNLHGYLADVGIMYDSPLAAEFTDVFFAAVNYHSIKRSMEIAKRTGKVFVDFDRTTYADGSYFSQYVSNEYLPKDAYISQLFEGIELPTPADWLELSADVARYGLRHAYRLCIAPTGSVSYLQSSTSSIMPITERIEQRTYGNSKTYYPMPNLNNRTWHYYKEAYDMDMFKVVDVVAAAQQHIDQGISFTLFMRDTHTTRDMTKIDLYAHHKGVKTIYYARTKNTSIDECVACAV